MVGKLLEQVVAGVICHHLSEHRLLSDRQFSFRPGRSTVDHLILLSQGWQDALEEGLDTLVVAFDRIWHAGLVKKALQQGYPGQPPCTTRGLPPGENPPGSHQWTGIPAVTYTGLSSTVLGPILWNIYINDLLRPVLTLLSYADNCSLSRSYCHSKSKRAIRELNRQFRLVTEWDMASRLHFREDAGHGHFMVPSCLPGRLRLSEFWRPDTEHIKLLGVTVDCGRRFDSHVAAVAHQASQQVSVLHQMAGNLNSMASLTLQGSDTDLYGVQCLVLDVECPHPLAETERCAMTLPALGGDGRTVSAAAGGADLSHVTRALAGHVGTVGPAQGPGSGGPSSQLTKAPTTSCPEGVQDHHLQ